MVIDSFAKLKTLPPKVKEAIFNAAAQSTLKEIEKKYGFMPYSLAVLIGAKEVYLSELSGYLQRNFKLTEDQSQEVKSILINKVFQPILGYLDYKPKTTVEKKYPTPPVLAMPTKKVVAAAPAPAEPSSLPAAVKVPKLAAELKVKETEINRSEKAIAGYNIDFEDEEEIKKFLSGSNQEQRVAVQEILRQEALRLIKLANINFTETAKQIRLQNITVAYLRGVRDWVETRGFLMHNPQAGGVSFNKEEAEDFLAIIDKQRHSLTDLLTESKATKPVQKQVSESTNVASKISKPVLEIVPGNLQVPTGFKKAADLSLQKPVVEDIKYAKKLVGPLEELAGYSLIDFRRLNPDPAQACQKIKGKIELLEAENFAKKIEGIKAWKKSPTNQLYLAICQQAITENKDLATILKERQQNNLPTLTVTEIEAIMKLNGELKY